MWIELDRLGRGVAAFMLSLNTLFALEKNASSLTMSWLISWSSLWRGSRLSMRRRACEARLHGEPLSISSSNFTPVSLAIGAGDSSII